MPFTHFYKSPSADVTVLLCDHMQLCYSWTVLHVCLHILSQAGFVAGVC